MPPAYLADPVRYQNEVRAGSARWRPSDLADYNEALAGARRQRTISRRTGRRNLMTPAPRDIVFTRPSAPPQRSSRTGRFTRSAYRGRLSPDFASATAFARDMGLIGIVKFQLMPNGVMVWIPEVTP